MDNIFGQTGKKIETSYFRQWEFSSISSNKENKADMLAN